MAAIPMNAYSRPLRLAVTSKISSLDPIKQDDVTSSSTIIQIYEGLFGYGKQHDIEPVLVSDWRISTDRKTYTFVLKDNVVFSNGKKLVASDVKYSFERLASRDSLNAWALQVIDGYDELRSRRANNINGIKALDAKTIKIVLKEPYRPFLSLLASAYFRIVLPSAGKNGCPPLVGTGPYICDELIDDEQVILIRNPSYHSKLNNIERIVYKVMPLSEALKSFNMGDIDLIKYYDNSQLVTRTDAAEIDAYQFSIWYNAFNISKFPGSNLNFRKSLFHAIDKTAITNIIGNGASVAYGLLPEGFWSAKTSNLSSDYDPILAWEYLKKVKLPPDFKIEFLVCQSMPKASEIAKYYEDVFDNLGLKYNVSIVDFKRFYDRKRKGHFTLILTNTMPSFGDSDAILYPYFYSKSEASLLHHNISELDSMIIASRQEHDNLSRLQINTAINDFLVNGAYVIPLYRDNLRLYADRRLNIPLVNGLGAWFLEYKNLSWQ